jgi:hypothetical protein
MCNGFPTIGFFNEFTYVDRALRHSAPVDYAPTPLFAHCYGAHVLLCKAFGVTSAPSPLRAKSKPCEDWLTHYYAAQVRLRSAFHRRLRSIADMTHFANTFLKASICATNCLAL